jgi:hypothetical protein
MTSAETFLAESVAPTKARLLGADDVPPMLLVFGLAALALAWNVKAGLSFTMPLGVILAGPAACFALCAYYTWVRKEPKIAQVALYVGLWLFYPAFGAQLTYLATTANFPLQDGRFAALDGALGFDWMGWARFVLAHPLFKAVGDAAYASCFWQPLAAIFIFAGWGPKGRNGEFLTSVILGLLLTVAISIVLPTIGPADSQHIRATGQIVEALRNGFKGPYTFIGIIAFPSFHTVMAILFTVSFRGHRWLMAGFGLLNLLMLSAVPFQGDHYLVDMIAGAAIAGVAFVAARLLCRVTGDYSPRNG